jgi:hypothetical protein
VIAIRDGRTASETMRQGAEEPAGDDLDRAMTREGITQAQHFEELVVVDSVGRLQLPQEYLRRLNIKGRVLLELREGEVAIRPAVGRSQAPEAPEAAKLARDLATAAQARHPVTKWRPRWWPRTLRRTPGSDQGAE